MLANELILPESGTWYGNPLLGKGFLQGDNNRSMLTSRRNQTCRKSQARLLDVSKTLSSAVKASVYT